MDYTYPDTNSISPLTTAMLRRLGSPVDGLSPEWMRAIQPQITLLEAPAHGRISAVDASTHHYNYAPAKGYEGRDRIAWVVEGKGQRFKSVLRLGDDDVLHRDRLRSRRTKGCAFAERAEVVSLAFPSGAIPTAGLDLASAAQIRSPVEARGVHASGWAEGDCVENR